MLLKQLKYSWRISSRGLDSAPLRSRTLASSIKINGVVLDLHPCNEEQNQIKECRVTGEKLSIIECSNTGRHSDTIVLKATVADWLNDWSISRRFIQYGEETECSKSGLLVSYFLHTINMQRRCCIEHTSNNNSQLHPTLNMSSNLQLQRFKGIL